jgi:hypothetical protein
VLAADLLHRIGKRGSHRKLFDIAEPISSDMVISLKGEATVTETDSRLRYVGRRAYELARSGQHADFASIQQAIMREGYADGIAWLELPGVMAALTEICAISREDAESGDAGRIPGRGLEQRLGL